MAAMKVRPANMNSKSMKKEMQQSVHEEIDDDSDEEMGNASENSVGDEESSVEESDVGEASGEENSEDDDEEEHEEGSVEDDNDSGQEEGEDDDVSDDDDDEMEDLSDDGDLGAGDWMEFDGKESNSDLSSSDDEASSQGAGQKADSNDPNLHGNSGWADAMAKILRTSKPKGKKSVVLAKAKKLSQIGASEKSDEDNKEYGFEIDGDTAEKEDVKPNVDDLDVKPDVEDIKPKIRKKELSEGRLKPDIISRDRERALSKIATKGVVQLFNAVREQQKDINQKMKLAKGSIRKEEKILQSVDKRSFLNSLMGAKSVRVEDHVQKKAEEDVKPENPTTWNILRDNFLTGSDMKDWDKSGEIKLEDDMDEIELY